MNSEVIAAIIMATGAIIAALIGVMCKKRKSGEDTQSFNKGKIHVSQKNGNNSTNQSIVGTGIHCSISQADKSTEDKENECHEGK